jgi:hypothetical protein
VFVRWKSAGHPKDCLECIAAQNAANTPLNQRITVTLPCPIHGDPAYLWPENQTVWRIYEQMAGNLIYQTYQDGDRPVVKPFLDILVVRCFADAYQIDFLDLLDRLQIIVTGLYE